MRTFIFLILFLLTPGWMVLVYPHEARGEEEWGSDVIEDIEDVGDPSDVEPSNSSTRPPVNTEVNPTAKNQENVETWDLNNDGFPEIRIIYDQTPSGRRLARKEIDVNSDGVFDVVRIYDSGKLYKVILDFDYDGKADMVNRFDSNSSSETPSLVSKEVDLQWDGLPDIRRFYVRDRLFKRETDENQDGQPDRFEYYSKRRLVRTEFDDDGDGISDRWGVAQEKDRFPYLKPSESKPTKNTLQSDSLKKIPTVKLKPDVTRKPATKRGPPKLNIP